MRMHLFSLEKLRVGRNSKQIAEEELASKVQVARARKNLEAAPRIIFAVFTVFCRFAVLPAFFAVFRRFRCFSAVFHPFSLFLTVFHSFFYPFSSSFYRFFHRFSWIFSQDILDSAFCQDRMGSEPQGEGQPPFYPGKNAEPTNSGFRL